jgi:hypothetical protein
MKFKSVNFNGNKNYLKLSDGESVKGVFRGDPYDFRQHWGQGRSVLCQDDSCERCAAGETSSFRFRINFVVNENGVYTAKIFEQGATVYGQLKLLHESDYDLEKMVVTISRHGSNKNNTIYNILPVKNGEIKNGTLKIISQIKLHDLEHPSPKEGHEAAEEQNDFVAQARRR